METRMAALMHDPNLRSSDLHMQESTSSFHPCRRFKKIKEFFLLYGISYWSAYSTHSLVIEKCGCVITSFVFDLHSESTALFVDRGQMSLSRY
jgi:hypothetical protein